ncbi:hypothetical protein [Streptomyces blastmyceticus]|uniref:Uncharacterized protein n=1 Tax=Streptomyces blastmyceticus TaxID=68180 RepID=A0ABP3H9Z5_9ACTN
MPGGPSERAACSGPRPGAEDGQDHVGRALPPVQALRIGSFSRRRSPRGHRRREIETAEIGLPGSQRDGLGGGVQGQATGVHRTPDASQVPELEGGIGHGHLQPGTGHQ